MALFKLPRRRDANEIKHNRMQSNRILHDTLLKFRFLRFPPHVACLLLTLISEKYLLIIAGGGVDCGLWSPAVIMQNDDSLRLQSFASDITKDQLRFVLFCHIACHNPCGFARQLL